MAQEVPVSLRPEIDRWLLSNLHTLISTCRREFENYNTPGVCNAAAAFIDDLSNWYIRRNRRRFWRSREAGDFADKLAAYQTLFEALVTLSKLLAPCIPFLCERMYQNLVLNWLKGRQQAIAEAGIVSPEFDEDLNEEPTSVHLCRYPITYPECLDPELNERMALAQLVVKLGHKLREEADLRVRQPLAELRFACQDPQQRAAIERLADVIEEELNLKKLTSCDHLDDLVSYVYKPNQKALGPKYGKLLGAITAAVAAADPQTLAPLRRGESVELLVSGPSSVVSGETTSGSATSITLTPADIVISTQQAAEWVSIDERGVQIALSTHLTPELIQEGIARDFVRQVQQLRKDANLEIQARIKVCYSTDDADVLAALQSWGEYIKAETLANSIESAALSPPDSKPVSVGSTKVTIWIEIALS